MKTSEAIDYFGSKAAVARALGRSKSTVSMWDDYPPDLAQQDIERVTNGALKAEPRDLPGLKACTRSKQRAKKRKAA